MSHPSRFSQHQTGFMFGERPNEAYNPESLVPPVRHVGGSVMIWAAIFGYSAGQIITVMVELLPETMWTF